MANLSKIPTCELQQEINRRAKRLAVIRRVTDRINRKFQEKLSALTEEQQFLEVKPMARFGVGNHLSLCDAVEKLLADYPKGMSVEDIAKKVVENGYATTSKNFRAVCNVGIAKDDRFERIERGVYKLAKR